MSRIRRTVLILLATFAFVFAGSGSAFADAPLPLMPDGSVGGGLLKVGDDIKPGSCKDGGTYFECYGVAGQFHTDADTGVVNGLGDKAKGAANDAANLAANALMTLAQMSTSSTATFADNVYGADGDYQLDPSGNGDYKAGNWLGAFEPLWTSVSEALKEGFTSPFAPLIGLIVLITGLVALIRGHISGVFVTFVLTFVAVGMVTVGTNYPIAAGRGADKIIVETTSAFREAVTKTDNATSPGYALVGGIADRIIVDRWIAGTLGDSVSVTAQKYGPVLYEAQAMSWDEARTYRADPNGAGKQIIERKQKEWTAAKDAIKAEDPVAYANLTGEQGAANRIGQAFMMNVVWLTAMPMILVSLILTALGFLLIRLVIVFLPVIGIIGAIPRFHGILRSTAEMFAAAVVNSVVFGAVATLVAVVNTFIMADSTGFDWGTRLLFAFVFTVIAWSATSPFRKLTKFVTNYDPFASAKGVLHSILGVLKTLALTLTGGAAAGAVAGAVQNQQTQPAGGLNPHPAEQQYTPRTTYTREDVNPPVYDAVLTEPAPRYAAPAIGDVIDVEHYESTLGGVPAERVALAIDPPRAGEAPTGSTVVLTDDTIVTPSRHPATEENAGDDGAYLIYDGGRYVMHNAAGDVVWDENEMDKEDADA